MCIRLTFPEQGARYYSSIKSDDKKQVLTPETHWYSSLSRRMLIAPSSKTSFLFFFHSLSRLLRFRLDYLVHKYIYAYFYKMSTLQRERESTSLDNDKSLCLIGTAYIVFLPARMLTIKAWDWESPWHTMRTRERERILAKCMMERDQAFTHRTNNSVLLTRPPLRPRISRERISSILYKQTFFCFLRLYSDVCIENHLLLLCDIISRCVTAIVTQRKFGTGKSRQSFVNETVEVLETVLRGEKILLSFPEIISNKQIEREQQIHVTLAYNFVIVRTLLCHRTNSITRIGYATSTPVALVTPSMTFSSKKKKCVDN
jgi:hypothetical protein